MGCKSINDKHEQNNSTPLNPNNAIANIPPSGSRNDNPHSPTHSVSSSHSFPHFKPVLSFTPNDNTDNVKISIPLPSGAKWESSFPKDTPIQQIISDFESQNPLLNTSHQKLKWKHNNTDLNLTTPIESFIPLSLCINHNNNDPIKIPLDISYEICIDENNEMLNNNNTSLIAHNASAVYYGIPLQNPFEVFVFSTQTGCFSLLTTNQQEIASIGLNKYSRLSAYCNGENMLYISGGECCDTKELLDDLWIVELTNGSIEQLPNAIVPKKMHSMLYLEENYLFIVGGNDCITILYDLNTKTRTEWKPLNVLRNEPTLALVNSYVYAFNISNGNEVLFERTNIHTESICEWELVIPVITEHTLFCRQKLFGIAACGQEEFMFLGGTMDSDDEREDKVNTCLCFNVNDNTLNVSDVKFEMLDLGEKHFHPYKDNIDFVIPTFNRNRPVIVLYNKTKSEYTSIPFHTETKSSNVFSNEGNDSKQRNVLSYSYLPKVNACKYNFNMPDMKASVNEYNNMHVIKAPLYMSHVIREVTDDEEIIDKEETQNVVEGLKAQNDRKIHTKLGDVYVNSCSEGNQTPGERKIEMKNAGMLFKSSVIKENECLLQNDVKLPPMNKSVERHANAVKISTNFIESEETFNELKNSVNVGCSGKKSLMRSQG